HKIKEEALDIVLNHYEGNGGKKKGVDSSDEEDVLTVEQGWLSAQTNTSGDEQIASLLLTNTTTSKGREGENKASSSSCKKPDLSKGEEAMKASTEVEAVQQGCFDQHGEHNLKSATRTLATTNTPSGTCLVTEPRKDSSFEYQVVYRDLADRQGGNQSKNSEEVKDALNVQDDEEGEWETPNRRHSMRAREDHHMIQQGMRKVSTIQRTQSISQKGIIGKDSSPNTKRNKGRGSSGGDSSDTLDDPGNTVGPPNEKTFNGGKLWNDFPEYFVICPKVAAHYGTRHEKQTEPRAVVYANGSELVASICKRIWI
ncbi:hypothetical protein IFM89_000540, partial [Coptis chinensis]